MIGRTNAVNGGGSVDTSYLFKGNVGVNTADYGDLVIGIGNYGAPVIGNEYIRGSFYQDTRWVYFSTPIDLTAKTKLTFKAKVESRNPASNNDALYVGLLATPVNTINTVPVMIAGKAIRTVSTEYIDYEVDLSGVTGEGYFEIYFYGVVAFVTDVRIL